MAIATEQYDLTDTPTLIATGAAGLGHVTVSVVAYTGSSAAAYLGGAGVDESSGLLVHAGQPVTLPLATGESLYAVGAGTRVSVLTQA